ncbi:MAG: ABC transporter permease, partial [Phycisphaerales bacterium]
MAVTPDTNNPNDGQAGAAAEAADQGRGVVHRLLGPLFEPMLRTSEFFVNSVTHVGHVSILLYETLTWIWRAMTKPKVRLGWPALYSQIVRVGARAMFIVGLVSGCVGLILVLQMAPPLDEFGQKPVVANIVGVAVLRELGPLIAAIVMTGF